MIPFSNLPSFTIQCLIPILTLFSIQGLDWNGANKKMNNFPDSKPVSIFMEYADQEMEETLEIVVSGGEYEERELDLSISVSLTGFTYFESYNINQVKLIGGYAEGSDFGVVTLTLLFPETEAGTYEFSEPGQFLRGTPGISFSAIEILGISSLQAQKGEITIDSYSGESGEWLSGSFKGTFTEQNSDTEYNIEGKFSAQR